VALSMVKSCVSSWSIAVKNHILWCVVGYGAKTVAGLGLVGSWRPSIDLFGAKLDMPTSFPEIARPMDQQPALRPSSIRSACRRP